MRTQYLIQVFNFLMTVYLIEICFHLQSFYCKLLANVFAFFHPTVFPIMLKGTPANLAIDVEADRVL